MDLVANVSLIVATLDLKVVKDIRGAIRSADIASGKGQPAAFIGPAPTPPPPLGADQEARIEPRLVIHPDPLIEPPLVFHEAPRFEASAPVHVPVPIEVEPTPAPSHSSSQKSPIQPPWAVMPWQTPVQIPPKVKVTIIRPDIINKGSLIDFFI